MKEGAGAPSARPVHRRLCIATITRARPGLLWNLLVSQAELCMPENVDVQHLVVENGPSPTLGRLIEDFQQLVPEARLHYRLERRLGIAYARNHALEFAMGHGFDLLIFVDDDEVVNAAWLVELLAERDRGDYDIVGSPVRLASPASDLPFWNRVVWRGVNRINLETEKRFVRMKAEGRADQIRIATGSWMGKLDFFRGTELRFDEELGMAGGEDWKLWDEAKGLGARTSWTPSAIALEVYPHERLTLSYCYRRERDHARMVAWERIRQSRSRALRRLPGSIFSRAYKLVIAFVCFPFDHGKGLVTCARHAGTIVGFLQGSMGQKSNHYESVTGTNP